MSLTATLLEPEHLEEVNFNLRLITKHFKSKYRLEYVEQFLGVINTAMHAHARTVGISVTLKTSTSQNNENITHKFIELFRKRLNEHLKRKFDYALKRYELNKEEIKNDSTIKAMERPRPNRFKSDVNYFFVRRVENEETCYTKAKSIHYTGFIFVNKDCFGLLKPEPSKAGNFCSTELHAIIAKCWKDINIEMQNGKWASPNLNISYYLLNRNDPHIVKYMAQTMVNACSYAKLKDKYFCILDEPGKRNIFNTKIRAPFPDEIKNRFIKLCIKYRHLENTTFKGRTGEYIEEENIIRVFYDHKRRNGRIAKKKLKLENIRVDENVILKYIGGIVDGQ